MFAADETNLIIHNHIILHHIETYHVDVEVASDNEHVIEDYNFDFEYDEGIEVISMLENYKGVGEGYDIF